MATESFQQDAFQQDAFQRGIAVLAILRNYPRIEPIYIVEIALKNSGPTLYLSDRNITFGGQAYENYIKDISGIEGEISRVDSAALNTDITITFKNDPYASYDYLVEIGDTYPFEGAECLIREVYLDDDDNPSDIVTIFKGVIDEPQDIDLLSFQCKVSSMMFQKDKQWQVGIIDTTTYPSAYEDVGKLEPFIYGSDILVPSIRVDWGAKTTLQATIQSDTTAGITLSDSTRFPASGTILIDNEEISYTSITNNVLSGVTRGVNSTTATSHNAGVDIWEKQTNYDSLLASHELHTIGAIYAEITGTLWRVTSGVAGLLSGGKHYLRASSQIKIDTISDGVTVTDDIVFYLAGLSNIVIYPNSTWGGWTNPNNAIDNNLATYAQDDYGSVVLRTYFPSTSYGAIATQHFHLKYSNPTGKNLGYRFNGSGAYTWLTDTGGVASTVQINRSGGSWDDWMEFANVYTTSGSLVYEVWKDVDYTPDFNKTGNAYRAGDIISTNLIDRFHAVVNGYKDPDGNYGGAGNVIERPDYIIKHFLVQKLGFDIGDIDTTSFSAAGTWYGTNTYKLGFGIYDTIVPSEFLNQLAFESRSTLRYIAGKWYLDVIPDTSPAAIKTISSSELAGKFSKFKFNKTPIVDIANYVTAVFKRDYSKAQAINSDWLLTSVNSDAISEGKYGIYPKDFEFECIRDQATADSVLAHILLQRAVPLLIVTFPVFWEHFDLKEGDTFDIDNLLYNAKKFYIERFKRLDKFKAEIEAIEWYN